MARPRHFVWSSEIDQETCTGFASSGLQLAMSGTALAGVMVRRERPLPCGSGTRTLVTQGEAALERTF